MVLQSAGRGIRENPETGAKLLMPSRPGRRSMVVMTAIDELRRCHGFTVDTHAGHLGSVLHVREPRPGELELHVATAEGVVIVPATAVRHFDSHEQRLAVVLPVAAGTAPKKRERAGGRSVDVAPR